MSTPHDAEVPNSPSLPSPAPPNPQMIGTDLPGSLAGSSGITPKRIEALLDAALAAVPAPPLHDTSPGAVMDWLTKAQEGLWSRRQQRWLARQVAQILSDERDTAECIQRTRATIRHRAEIQDQKRNGTYWTELDARRRAQRPARFRVDDDTWNRLRQAATHAGSTLGEHLGTILTAAAERLATHRSVPGIERTGDDSAGGRTRFIRIAIDDHHWDTLKVAATQRGSPLIDLVSAIVKSNR